MQLTQVTLGDRTYPLVSDCVVAVKVPSKTGNTVSNTVGMSAVGALIGGVAGGGVGAAVGAGIGGRCWPWSFVGVEAGRGDYSVGSYSEL